MNWRHLTTLLWVRWRLTVNHIRRQGLGALILVGALAGLALVVSLVGFFTALIVGATFLEDVEPATIMLMCDVWILVFLGFWLAGLVNDLQRSEMLSVDKLLHLPTKLTEVYLFNFLSSLVSLTTLTLVPPMLGFSIALVQTKGPAALIMFPLLAGFVLTVCAVTYQFRGWLATVMANKRRQKTIMTAIGLTFLVLTQLPNIFAMRMREGHRGQAGVHAAEQAQALSEVRTRFHSGKITREEEVEELAEVEARFQAERDERQQADLDGWLQLLAYINLVVPLGWIALGAKAAAAGNPWIGLAGVLGLTSIVAVSLRRSYVTTLRYFTGHGSRSPHRQASVPASAPAAAAASPLPRRESSEEAGQARPSMLEWRMPFVSEPVSVIAWATLRSLTRAPEVKMILFGPLLMLIMYGAMVLPSMQAMQISDATRAFLPFGVLGIAISGLTQLSHNSFSFDRSGFRTYVLSGVSRRDILLGKNLAHVPLVFLFTLPMLILVQCLAPASASNFVGTLIAIPTVYLTLSLLGNVSSILSPIAHAAGSLRPVNSRGLSLFLQFVFGVATLVVLGIVASLPVAAELLSQHFMGVSPNVPLTLIVSLIEFVACVTLYRAILHHQGIWLQTQECRILEVITEKGE